MFESRDEGSPRSDYLPRYGVPSSAEDMRLQRAALLGGERGRGTHSAAPSLNTAVHTKRLTAERHFSKRHLKVWARLRPNQSRASTHKAKRGAPAVVGQATSDQIILLCKANVSLSQKNSASESKNQC